MRCLEIGEVVFAIAISVHICGAAVQSTTKGIGVTQFHLDNFHPKLVHLLGLIDL